LIGEIIGTDTAGHAEEASPAQAPQCSRWQAAQEIPLSPAFVRPARAHWIEAGHVEDHRTTVIET